MGIRFIKFFVVIILSTFIFFSCDKSKKTEEKESAEKENIENERQHAFNVDEQSKDEQQSTNLDFLKKYNGKYPYEVNLFENKDFITRLKNLLGNRYDFLVSTWAVELPIKVNGDIFIAEACMAHNCDATNFIIGYDFSKNVMYAGIREEYQVETFSEDGSQLKQINNWAK